MTEKKYLFAHHNKIVDDISTQTIKILLVPLEFILAKIISFAMPNLIKLLRG